MSKKTWILIACLVLSLALGLGGSLAYLTDKDTDINTFTMGKVDISIVEENFTDGDPLKPGLETDKDAMIKNIGQTDAWVWMTVEVPAHLKDYVTPVWSTGVGADSIVEDADGNKIYTVRVKEKLSAGQTTPKILDAVFTSAALDTQNDQLVAVVNGVATPIEGPLEVTVKAFAVQWDGLDSVDLAYEAYNNQWNNAEGGASGDEEEPTVPEVQWTEVVTLEQLRDAVAAGGNVKLTGSIELSSRVTIPTGVEVALDLNGMTLSCNVETVIENKGILTIKGGNVSSSTNNWAIMNYGDLTIDGTTVEMNGSAAIRNFADSKLTITGTSVIKNDISNQKNSDVTVVIEGGTFAFDPTEYVPTTGYTVTKIDDNTWTVTAAQ